MSDWTLDSMPDCSEWTVVVTGANSGIGFETTRAFAAHGATVIMGCRSLAKADDARGRIESENPPGELIVEELDLADLTSVREFADRITAQHPAIEVLVNNAGVMATPHRTTEDGFELQFGINHLGHFALTAHLLDAVLAGNWESRIVTVSSRMHEQGEIDFEDLNSERSYGKWDAYGQSKLANLLFTFELGRRLEAADADAISVAAHPGWAATELQSKGPEMAGQRLRKRFMNLANALIAQSAEQGAWPTLYAATHPELSGGEFVGPSGFLEMRGSPAIAEPAEHATDVETARRLWDRSEELTDVSFDLPAPPTRTESTD